MDKAEKLQIKKKKALLISKENFMRIILLALLSIFPLIGFTDSISKPFTPEQIEKFTNSENNLFLANNARNIDITKLKELFYILAENKELKDFQYFFNTHKDIFNKYNLKAVLKKDIDSLEKDSGNITIAKNFVDNGYLNYSYTAVNMAADTLLKSINKKELQKIDSTVQQYGYKGFSSPFNNDVRVDIILMYHIEMLNIILNHYNEKIITVSTLGYQKKDTDEGFLFAMYTYQ